MEQKKRKHHNRSALGGQKKLILIFDGVLVIALLAAVVWLVVTLSGRGKNGSIGAAAAQDPQAQTEASAAVSAQAEAAQPASVEQPYAAALTLADDGHPQSVDFSALSSEGVPAVAWLYSPGTAISYPVVQTLDNEYYMERNERGKRDANGAIFLNCRNAAELVDAQITIFGNPAADGTMFGSLLGYRDQAYLAAHPTLYLYTAQKSYRIDVFAARTASPDMANYPTWFENDSARATFVKNIRAESLIQSDMTVASNATIVSLVTTSDFDAGAAARFVVHGVLTEI